VAFKLKNILVISPTMLEFDYLRPALSKFHINHLICGIGPVNSMFNILIYIDKTKPDFIILSGIGGALKESGVAKNDVCIAVSEIFADLGRCEEEAIIPVNIENEQSAPKKFCLQKYWQNYLNSDILNKSGIKPVDMITVCCSTACINRLNILRKNFDFQMENMEGASVAMICEKFNIPLIELRGVSNYIYENNNLWNIKGSLEQTSRALKKVLTFLL
jgi:futalosine hydrolase